MKKIRKKWRKNTPALIKIALCKCWLLIRKASERDFVTLKTLTSKASESPRTPSRLFPDAVLELGPT